MKICGKCKCSLNTDEFYVNSNANDKLSAWCKTCQKKHKKQDYQKNKQRYYKNYYDRIKWFIDLKKNLKCERCGFNHPAALDFHHKDPGQKEFGISNFKFNKDNNQKILDEISKCEVLCSNCHRIEHAKHYNNIIKR